MALNTTGPISIGGTTVGQSVNLELKLAATATSSLGDAAFRGLAKVPSGEISLNNFYGKSSLIILPAISSNTLKYALTPSSVPGYVAGETAVQLDIDAGVYLYSDNTSTAGLTISGFVAGDTIQVNNAGYIMGMGGSGGASSPLPRTPAANGGAAVAILPLVTPGLGYVVALNNTGIIGGGGGGGDYGTGGGGGGAGGGTGGRGTAPGGIGGTINSVGSNGTNAQYQSGGAGGGKGGGAGGGGGGYGVGGASLPLGGGGGGGGRIFPGAGGAGGEGGVANANGGAGGGGGASGSPGQSGTAGGGGGGWGASGATTTGARPGGIGGKAVSTNGNSITTSGSGTTYGAVS